MTFVASSVLGCAQIRKLTYPPDFVYLEKKDIHGLMRAMTDSIVRIDRLVAEDGTGAADATQQQKIIDELGKLESTAIRISGGFSETHHFVISDNIEQFIGDVSRAKVFASANPPNYYSTGKITGSCLACHQFR